ncbi:MAG TPA: hypothetical protein VFY23_04270 [Candidatus Limnocylindrales bacterium]|nr:hypothetical protein [Candidatus Limnocylindrales bacterium]
MRVLRVPKNVLVLLAGLLWCVAGAMVMYVGLPLLLRLAPAQPALIPLAGAVFAAFYVLVFSRLVRKHTRRIREHPDERLPAWSCFSPSSWLVMAVMMVGGTALRATGVMPEWVIAFFYSGLGVALFLCGVRFLGVFARGEVLVPVPEPSTT